MFIKVQKLFVFVALILIFLIPFGTAVESILHKTQNPSLTVIKWIKRYFKNWLNIFQFY